MTGSDKREAPRFRSAIPVVVECSEGVTRDCSSLGVFFETDGSFSLGQAIEFSIVLDHVYPDRPVWIACKGAIVRVEKNKQKTGVASTIDSYSIIVAH